MSGLSDWLPRCAGCAAIKGPFTGSQWCDRCWELQVYAVKDPAPKPGCRCGGTCNTCRIIAQYDGCVACREPLSGVTVTEDDSRQTYHLDCWHKLNKKPKAPWRLLPMEAMPYVLEALALGAAKYPGDADWRQRPYIETESWEAAMRHMSWLAVGTELDAEGPHHAACVIARMLFILAKYDERKKKTQP